MALRLTVGGSRSRRCVLTAMLWRPVLAFALLFSSPALLAETSLEYRVKAAYLYNFTKFVEWPAESYSGPDTPLRICVLGTDPFGSTLDETVRGKKINDHSIEIHRISQPSDISSCKVVYFGPSEGSRLSSHLTALDGLPVLTVSDEPEFLKLGGMMRFIIIDGRVRFEVNRKATDETPLAVSSKLLSVAHNIIKGPGN